MSALIVSLTSDGPSCGMLSRRYMNSVARLSFSYLDQNALPFSAGSQRGPALKGNAFWSKYENDNLATLFMYLRDNMPQDGPSLVNETIKADILAYIMSA